MGHLVLLTISRCLCILQRIHFYLHQAHDFLHDVAKPEVIELTSSTHSTHSSQHERHVEKTRHSGKTVEHENDILTKISPDKDTRIQKKKTSQEQGKSPLAENHDHDHFICKYCETTLNTKVDFNFHIIFLHEAEVSKVEIWEKIVELVQNLE